MTPTELCKAAIRLLAARFAACTGGSANDYLRFANLCPDYYFGEDSNRTLADVAACLASLSAQTCTDIALLMQPSCLATGKRPTGAACVYPSQCQSGLCALHRPQCYTCVEVSTVGGPCQGGHCPYGSFCHPTTKVCTDGATIVYATQGQPCDLTATPVVGCAGALLCLNGSRISNVGVCSPAPGAGEPAAANSAGMGCICEAGATCADGGVSGTRTCTLATCGAGPQCDDASYCAPHNGALACVPRPTVGQACDPLSAPCLLPAVCLASTGKCAIPRGLKESCDADSPCADTLACVAGTCVPSPYSDCPPAGSDGGTG